MSRMEPARLRRYGERGQYELADVEAVFNDAFIAHVSYIDDGFPACQPMLALLREEEEDAEDHLAETNGVNGTNGVSGEARKTNAYVYLHGHPTSRLMELVKKATKEEEAAKEAATTANGDGPATNGPVESKPVKVCITATKIDGLVLSSAPNGHSFNYRSAMIHGTCSQVRGKDIKTDIMNAVTNKIVTNRVEEVNPISSMVVNMVYIIRVSIDRLSVKARKGVPGIQPRFPEVDGPDVEPRAWAGVVPMWEHLGEPVDAGLTPGAKVSENLRTFIAERNARHEAYSKSVAK